MKKFLTLILVIVLSPFIGGLYGIIHDQLTYTISPEYYTKLKFYQFGLTDTRNEAIFANPRIAVSAVGFMATWWTGFFIGLILGLVGLIHADYKKMFRETMRAIGLTIIITFLTGLVGLAYGKIYLADAGVNWLLPDNIIDTKNFISVGSMHNFSYLGGLIGMIGGIIYSIRQKRKYAAANIKNQNDIH